MCADLDCAVKLHSDKASRQNRKTLHCDRWTLSTRLVLTRAAMASTVYPDNTGIALLCPLRLVGMGRRIERMNQFIKSYSAHSDFSKWMGAESA